MNEPRTTSRGHGLGLPLLFALAAGLPAQAPAAPPPAPLALPEAVEPLQLQRWLQDLPQDYVVFDLRPAWQYAEWHLPQAANVAVADVAARVAALPASARIVLVDRDGTTAFAVAGALMVREPQRGLRALAGGLQRYYREVELAAARAPMPAGAPVPSQPSAPAAAPARKRSAGC